MSSAAEFVEGGAQDPCDDACSICLESFCDDDPATVTSCKHEYHLQCILEWSQRSKECPMCLQPLSLKDPDSQELLKAVGRERAVRRNKIQASHIYQRSPVEEYEFDRFASYGDEDFIMQHLAAAAMGRAHQMGRREHIRFRPSTTAQGHPHFVLVSGTPAGAPSSPASSSPAASPPQITNHEPSLTSVFTYPHYSGANSDGSSTNSPTLRSRSIELEEHGTSSSESLDTFKSRLVAASSRCKETLTKSTKGFRERLRTRGGIMQDLGARAREVSAGVARAIERMSIEPGPITDRADAAPDSPSDPIHHPPDRHGSSGSASEGSPTQNSSAASLSTASLTTTPELRSGADH
jgi:E3 ubiquitin-protein ligase RHF